MSDTQSTLKVSAPPGHNCGGIPGKVCVLDVMGTCFFCAQTVAEGEASWLMKPPKQSQ